MAGQVLGGFGIVVERPKHGMRPRLSKSEERTPGEKNLWAR